MNFSLLRSPVSPASWRSWAICLAAVAMALCVSIGRADTSAFTIVNDPALDAAVANARSRFLASRTFNRLSATLLVKQPDGSWKRGSYEADRIEYPASCVKLAYLASAMHWCRTNGKPYDFLDASVRPMITVSDNVATGEVVDAITGAPNVTNPNKPGTITFTNWLNKRLYTENFLVSRGLLDNQTILHKTYPSNSGSSPTGYEADAQTLRGGNRMQPKLSASLMLEIIYGAIEPGANAYMRELLTHARHDGDSAIGWGVPPGSIYQNKLGVAYDTVEDIAYVKLPNGKEFILAVYTNGWVTGDPYPYDAASPGVFCDMLIEELNLASGGPAILRWDNTASNFATTGAWTVLTADTDKYGTNSLSATRGSGATATWNLSVPTTGKYEVTLWWTDGTNRSAATEVRINHATGTQVLSIDQTKRGGLWVPLGSWDFNAGTGSVVIAAGTSGTGIVVADALRIAQHPAQGGLEPPSPGTLVTIDNDNGSPYYTEGGGWSTSATSGFNGLSYRFAAPAAANTATWTADLTESGSYDVSVWYRASGNRCTSTGYRVLASNGTQTRTVNQTANDQTWTSLGTFSFNAGLNSVVLDGGISSGGDVIIADAVRFSKVATPPSSYSVQGIALSAVNGGGGKKKGQAVVTVRDNQGNAVANASVTGRFTGSFNETLTGTTNASGQVTLTTSARVSGTPAFGFCVTASSHATLGYNAAGNTVTCSNF